MPSEEAISDALDEVGKVVPLGEMKDADDGRRTQWAMSGPFPEVRIVGAGGPQFRDWAWMRENLRNAIHGRPFPDRRNDEVRPLSDEQCRKIEKGTLRKHRRNKDAKAKDEPKGEAEAKAEVGAPESKAMPVDEPEVDAGMQGETGGGRCYYCSPGDDDEGEDEDEAEDEK